MLGFELSEPGTLDEAFELLADGDPGVRPMGGGTALMLMMKAQIFKPERLVSLRNVGGCFDGLMPTGLNRNQGAESILALQLASCAISGLSKQAESVAGASRAAA